MVIGAGNIGRRHLQALTNLKRDHSLYALDPSMDALDLAFKMYNEVKTSDSPKLYRADDIKKLPSNIFTVIVATSSRHRYHVTKSLFEKEIQHIIFEKVLFQNPDEYHEIEYHLINNNIQSWVNCWRRAVPFYRELIKSNQSEGLISLNVKGDNWGIASNAIHFIDLLSYINNFTDYQFNENIIEIVQSKRSGYHEFVGEMKGAFGSGLIPFSFQSIKTSDNISCVITLEFENKTIIIDDDQGWWIEKSFNKSEIRHKVKIPYQSEMTHLHINDLAEGGNCSLTPFYESCKLHLPMIEYFTSIFKQNGIQGCPVT